jgi:hypothetical protein
MGRWLAGVHYVSTGLVVAALARPEWLVEIDVIAVIPAWRSEEAQARRFGGGRRARGGIVRFAGRVGWRRCSGIRL